MEDNAANPPINTTTPQIIQPGPKIKPPNFFRGFNRTKSLTTAILSIFILTGAIGIGTYLVITQKQSTKVGASSAVLTLSPNQNTPHVGDVFTVAVAVNTSGLSVSAADLRVRYDTTKLEAQNIKALGDFLPTILVPGTIDLTDTSSGRASIVLGAKIDQNGAYPKSGIGVLAQITFKAKAAGPTDITFGTSTQVAAVGQNTNVVGALNPTTIDIVTPPTPSPSPSLAPSSSPLSSPSPIPTCRPRPACLDAKPHPCLPPEPVGGWCSSSPSPTPSCDKAKKGDIDCDGKIDIVDVGILIDNYGKNPPPNPKADLNGDGKVDIVDVGILIDNYGK